MNTSLFLLKIVYIFEVVELVAKDELWFHAELFLAKYTHNLYRLEVIQNTDTYYCKKDMFLVKVFLY